MSRKRSVIYTAAFGDHDVPSEVWDAECDLVCFTDNPALKLKTWDVRQSVVTGLLDASPRMKAKWFKLNATWLFAEEYEHSIWLDAAFWVHSARGFVDHCLAHLHDGIAFYPHPAYWRSLEQEAIISGKMPKYDGEPMAEQVEHYRKLGLVGGTLLCGGVIPRVHTKDIALLEERWLKECRQWSSQDQLALPYCLWKEGIRPGLLPGDIYSNDYLVHLWSGTKK